MAFARTIEWPLGCLPPRRVPVEIISGELFRVDVYGELRVTRMEHLYGEGYYSIDGYPLRDDMRVAIGSGE